MPPVTRPFFRRRRGKEPLWSEFPGVGPVIGAVVDGPVLDLDHSLSQLAPW